MAQYVSGCVHAGPDYGGCRARTRRKEPVSIPDDFPRFSVPGAEAEMDALRLMYWHHLIKDGPPMEEWVRTAPYPVLPFGRTGPLWDGWLGTPHLWPGVDTADLSRRLHANWRRSLGGQRIDEEGYVATIQSLSYTHNDGWPFPCWHHLEGGIGWHFSFVDTQGIRPELAFRPPGGLNTTQGWRLHGVADAGIDEQGWRLKATGKEIRLDSPQCRIMPQQAPFVQVRWTGSLSPDAQAYVAWTTAESPEFDEHRRMYFDAPGQELTRTMLPVYQHPAWKGDITRLRLGVHENQSGAKLTIVSLFTHFDSRHNVNNANFIQGCANYFCWTADVSFLRQNISRIRRAMKYAVTEFRTLQEKVVLTPWVGHDGVSMLVRGHDGQLRLRPGHGIGNNYDDIVPNGHRDCYATIQFYSALNDLSSLEDAIGRHPEWNIPTDAQAQRGADYRKHAVAVRQRGNRLFWDDRGGRFFACVDALGVSHDHGYTLLNTEAVTSGFATETHARQIMKWLDGARQVVGDTSRGADIYRWRLAPRWTTLDNMDWWGTLPPPKWNASVLNGGAILGWSYFDVLARIKVLGADNAWARLREIAHWFAEVQAAGGYRQYYSKLGEGLQGAGIGGSLGIDLEFFESVMVPSAMLTGFMGFRPTADGFALNPRLATAWPELTIDRVRWRDLTLRLRATHDTTTVETMGADCQPSIVEFPTRAQELRVPLGASLREATRLT